MTDRKQLDRNRRPEWYREMRHRQRGESGQASDAQGSSTASPSKSSNQSQHTEDDEGPSTSPGVPWIFNAMIVFLWYFLYKMFLSPPITIEQPVALVGAVLYLGLVVVNTVWYFVITLKRLGVIEDVF